MDAELTKGMLALGVGLGSGAVGALATHITYKRRQATELVERRKESTAASIRQAVSEAVSLSMERHLGTKNGEIRQDIADIKAFMTMVCPKQHIALDKRVDAIEVTAEDALKQATETAGKLDYLK